MKEYIFKPRIIKSQAYFETKAKRTHFGNGRTKVVFQIFSEKKNYSVMYFKKKKFKKKKKKACDTRISGEKINQ